VLVTCWRSTPAVRYAESRDGSFCPKRWSGSSKAVKPCNQGQRHDGGSGLAPIILLICLIEK
jgi:hypothetical protein